LPKDCIIVIIIAFIIKPIGCTNIFTIWCQWPHNKYVCIAEWLYKHFDIILPKDCITGIIVACIIKPIGYTNIFTIWCQWPHNKYYFILHKNLMICLFLKPCNIIKWTLSSFSEAAPSIANNYFYVEIVWQIYWECECFILICDVFPKMSIWEICWDCWILYDCECVKSAIEPPQFPGPFLATFYNIFLWNIFNFFT